MMLRRVMPLHGVIKSNVRWFGFRKKGMGKARRTTARKPDADGSRTRLPPVDDSHLYHDGTMQVAVLGQPNVGKSTLFNQLRLFSEARAIVHASPGVTRDRIRAKAYLGAPLKVKQGQPRYDSETGVHFFVTDTAGLELEKSERDYDWDNHTQLINSEMLHADLQKAMLDQALSSVTDADVVLFMFDARIGITDTDLFFAKWLRHVKQEHQTILVLGNKADVPVAEMNLDQGYKLGFGQPILFSAVHGEGMAYVHRALQQVSKVVKKRYALALEEAKANKTGDTVNAIAATSSSEAQDVQVQTRIELAIVGKPNVGKSTLVNSLLGENRVIVGDQPGITRDAIRVEWHDEQHPNHNFVLLDTAGLKTINRDALARSVANKADKSGSKHASNVLSQRQSLDSISTVDGISMQETLRTIAFAEVVALVFDAFSHLDDQMDVAADQPGRGPVSLEECLAKVRNCLTSADLAIARSTINEGRALVLVANKWDLVEKDQRKNITRGLTAMLLSHLPQVQNVTLLPMSALHKTNIKGFGSAVVSAYDKWNFRVGTGPLNRWLKQALLFNPPAKVNGKTITIRYISQVNTRPPRFALFCNRASDISDGYLRFLTNLLRKEYGLEGVPIRIFTRVGDNPYSTDGPQTSYGGDHDNSYV